MSDLVGNPEDRFSRVEALFSSTGLRFLYWVCRVRMLLLMTRLRPQELTQNADGCMLIVFLLSYLSEVLQIVEPPHGKANNLHMRKQRRRSASRS